MRRYAYVLVGGSPIADDLVQETLTRAIFYLRAGREVRNLRSYLLTTLHNVRVDYIKSDRRQGDLLPLDEHPQLAVPAAQLDQLECDEVAAAIAALPDDQREVLLLIGLEGLSYQEATEILGVPLGTVMSRLNRGRNAVKAQLGRDDAARPSKPVTNSANRCSSPANACRQ
ncbi:MAG TPA: RNA polymerase sigma factor [Dongiaceae bacterium]|nr:RNA polymerase sigma factor [Dongiaceae bacterium]